MKSRVKSVFLSLLALLFAVSICFSLAPVFAGAAEGDTDEFVLVTDVAADEDGTPTGTNSVALTDGTDGGVTVGGKQSNSRSIVVYDHGYSLGSEISFTTQIDQDFTGLTGDSLKNSVYFSIVFTQAEKTDGAFDANDFYFLRASGNGVSLQLFTGEDLAPDSGGSYRSMIRLATFDGKGDIINSDSMYHGTGVNDSDPGVNAFTDLGWAFSDNRPFTITMGTEKVGGVDNFYVSITVDRSVEVPGRVNTYKTSFPLSRLAIDDENTNPYYIGFEFSNRNATERNVSASISAITAEEAGLVATPESVFLKPEGTQQLSVKTNEGEDPEGLTYTSANTGVATVSATGLVTAVSAGTTTIDITDNLGRKGVAYVTIADEILLGASQLTVTEGGYTTLTASTNPVGLSVVWESSDEDVVTIDDNGLLHGVSAGTATVTGRILNFEEGALELKAECAVTVEAYQQPADVHENGQHYVYSDGVIVENGFTSVNNEYSINSSLQNGATYAIIGEGITFERAISFDFIYKADVNNTTYANRTNRYFGFSIAQGDADDMTADDLLMGSASGLQINLDGNAEWWNGGVKMLQSYVTGVGGTRTEALTPENTPTNPLEGTDRFGNAFARAFADGTRIQVRMWREGELFKVSFTPVFIEGEVPDGSEDMTYPSGGAADYVGPYTLQFNWSDIATGTGNWVLAVGVGNTIAAAPATANLQIENVNIGILNGVTVSRPSQQIKVGATFQLTGTLNPISYVPESAVWSSSNESVATVDQSGLVTAVKSGTATITYTVDGMSASCEVTVLGGLTVTEKEVSLKVGETHQLNATVDPSTVKPTFASGDDRIATVDENGKITAVGEGTVTIYVRVGSVFSSEVTVTVTADGTGGGTEEPPAEGGCSGSVGFAAGAVSAVLVIACVAFVIVKRKKA